MKKTNLFHNDDIQVDNCKINRPDGCIVSAWKIYKKNSTPKHRCIFLHATGNDALFPQISLFIKLIQSGIEIITLDLDGHGKNSTTIFEQNKIIDNLQKDLSILTSHSLIPSIIIGQSLGGALAIGLLPKLKEKIKISKLILISVPLNVKITKIKKSNEILGFFNPSFLSQMKYYGIYGSFPAVGLFKRKHFPIRLPENIKQLRYQKIIPQFIKELNLPVKSKKIEIPTLLIYGSLDTISPVSHGELLNRNIVDSQLIIVERENHFTTLLNSEVEKSIEDWIINENL